MTAVRRMAKRECAELLEDNFANGSKIAKINSIKSF